MSSKLGGWGITIPISIGGRETAINGMFLDEIDGLGVYSLCPSGCEETLCEVCGVDIPLRGALSLQLYYIEGERLRMLCAAHASGTSIEIGVARIAIEPETPEPPVSDRVAVHRLAAELHEQGFTHKEISSELVKRGCKEVSARTVAKHLRNECACFTP